MGKKQSMLELIREKEKEGKVVLQMINGTVLMNLDEIVRQPVEGLLWDLNRDKVTCAAWIDKGETGWVNNYAVALVITRLKEMLEDK